MIYYSAKKRLSLFSIFCLLAVTLTAQVAFQETSFSNAQIIIQEEKLPYIIYFYGSWCPSCQLMEETTFKNKKVNNRIEANYVVFKVNTDSEQGKEWMDIYGVTSVPATLFYSKANYLLNKLEAPITATDFLKITADLGKLPADAVLSKKANSLPSKHKETNVVVVATKKRINSAPNKVGSKDLNLTVAAINVEIEALKKLMRDHTPNIVTNKSSTNEFLGASKDKVLTPKGGNQITTPLAYPSTKTLITQIEACKTLLTGHNNIQRLIDILEDYKRTLVTDQEKSTVKKDISALTEYKIPIKKTVLTKSTNYQKLYARNQQIVNYLKLNSPVKRGNQFIVQIGKYKNIRNAERLVQTIQDKYDYPIKIHIQKQGNLPVQMVYIGEFKTKEEAIAANDNLKWINRKGVVKQF